MNRLSNGLWMARLTAACVTVAMATIVPGRLCAATGTLRIDVTDARGQPLPCRIHLQDAQGKPQTAPNTLSYADHFVCAETAQLKVPQGKYHYEIERGPEYERRSGDVLVGTTDTARVSVR